MDSIKSNEITKDKFLKLNEDNLLFITNPGRMGDEDGSTFIIKEDNELTIYRVEGWMYPVSGKRVDISFNDLLEQFPKWHETMKNVNEKDYKGKYTHLYMGFGNGLSIDNSIYNEFEPYLNNQVEQYLKNEDEEKKKELKYAAIFNVWIKAVVEMANDKGYTLK